MNDYECWATKHEYAEDLNDWYNKHIAENDIEDVRLCDLDKEGMWYITTDEKDIKRLGNNASLISEPKIQFGDLMKYEDSVVKFISFREAIKYDLDFTEPYCIASTEW